MKHTTCTTCGAIHDSGMDELVDSCPDCNGVPASPSVRDKLRARGLHEGSPEWQDAAARLLVGDDEWARLSRLAPDELAAELATFAAHER